MTDEEKRIVEWLRKDSRNNLRIAYESWAAGDINSDAGEKSIGDSIFHKHQVQDEMANAIERGDHMKGINNG